MSKKNCCEDGCNGCNGIVVVRGQQGPQGATGPQGPPGPTGGTGSDVRAYLTRSLINGGTIINDQPFYYTFGPGTSDFFGSGTGVIPSFANRDYYWTVPADFTLSDLSIFISTNTGTPIVNGNMITVKATVFTGTFNFSATPLTTTVTLANLVNFMANTNQADNVTVSALDLVAVQIEVLNSSGADFTSEAPFTISISMKAT
jgi:hypothetical protein